MSNGFCSNALLTGMLWTMKRFSLVHLHCGLFVFYLHRVVFLGTCGYGVGQDGNVGDNA